MLPRRQSSHSRGQYDRSLRQLPENCPSPAFEAQTGYQVGQDVWSLKDVAHSTKPLRYGDHGVVQGPGQNDLEKVSVLFDAPAGRWGLP